jgi:hypothetical protein
MIIDRSLLPSTGCPAYIGVVHCDPGARRQSLHGPDTLVRPVETAVFVVIALVLLVFVFLLGALGRPRDGEDAEALAADLEEERARVHRLEAEVAELRSKSES